MKNILNVIGKIVEGIVIIFGTAATFFLLVVGYKHVCDSLEGVEII